MECERCVDMETNHQCASDMLVAQDNRVNVDMETNHQCAW